MAEHLTSTAGTGRGAVSETSALGARPPGCELVVEAKSGSKVVIVALVLTVIVQREFAVRREMAHRDVTLRILVDLMAVNRERERERLVDKRQALLKLTQEKGAGAEFEARLLRARRDVQIAEEAVVLSTTADRQVRESGLGRLPEGP